MPYCMGMLVISENDNFASAIGLMAGSMMPNLSRSVVRMKRTWKSMEDIKDNTKVLFSVNTLCTAAANLG